MQGLTLDDLHTAVASLPVLSPWRQSPHATILPSLYCPETQAYAIHNRDRIADESEYVVVLHPTLRQRILAEAPIPEAELGQFLWWFAQQQRSDL